MRTDKVFVSGLQSLRMRNGNRRMRKMKTREVLNQHRNRGRNRHDRSKGAEVPANGDDASSFAYVMPELLLRQVVQFLATSGLPRETIARSLRNLADVVQAGETIPTARSQKYELIAGFPRVAHDWARSPKFTGTDGEPRALVLRGPRGLSVLIRRHFPRQKISSVVHCMTAHGAIRRRRDGRYVLLQRQVIYRRGGPGYLEWIAALATKYLQTAFANLKKGDPKSRNLDRLARVFDLPEKEVPRFREFAKNRTESWLEEIDNWLEDHSAPTRSQHTVEAGVHVYGYVGSLENLASTCL